MINVTIDLAALNFGYRDERPVTIEEAIVELAARQLLEEVKREGQGDAWGGLRTRVQELRDELIREQLEPLVVEAVNGQFQPTNAYGGPAGAPTTLRELIFAQGTKELSVRSQRERYGAQPTLLQEYVVAEVRSSLTTELKGALQEARDDVRAAVQEEGAKIIAETIERMARS